MTTPSIAPETTPSTRKFSVEHIVLGGVLVAVLLAAAVWFVLKPGSSSTAKAAAKPTASATVMPTVAPTTTAAAVAVKAVKAKPLTKAAYIKAGDKICAVMNAKAKALGPFPTTLRAQAVVAAKTFTFTEHARKQLQLLAPPAKDAAKLKALYVELAHLDTTGATMGKAMAAGNAALTKTLEAKVIAETNKANAGFDTYGLLTCGS